jgi:anion-transporting  ArsA/GET3 family ATPase
MIDTAASRVTLALLLVERSSREYSVAVWEMGPARGGRELKKTGYHELFTTHQGGKSAEGIPVPMQETAHTSHAMTKKYQGTDTT